MYIKKLNLTSYRNYLSGCFEFHNGVNVIYGMNAQGKTNVAEAIFFLCTGYSPRVTKEKQVIMYGSEKATISGEAVSRFGKVAVSIDFYASQPKKITVNGLQVQRSGELLGNINSVFFNPQELKLIQESPEDRRRFMDLALSQINRRYYYSLQKYKKILMQRNALLKEEDRELVLSTLPIWDEQFSEVAAQIIADRNRFIARLMPLAKKEHSFITDGREELEVKGEYKFEGDVQEIKAQVKQKLFENMERDCELGYTTIGPHRDDLKIKINGQDVRIYGSQGQQRTAALSLKLAELEIFAEEFGEYPVLILDDAMSELDKNRREKLAKRLEGIQTVVTCTDADQWITSGNIKQFKIDNGAIAEENLLGE